MKSLEEIQVQTLNKITRIGGDVWHVLKSSESSYDGFGEAYFSWLEPGAIKAWKKHLQMTMNLVVPIGKVRFVFYDFENEICEILPLKRQPIFKYRLFSKLFSLNKIHLENPRSFASLIK